MYSKADILHEIMHEIKIIKHLSTKVPANGLDYKPSEKQRSLLELMQYISIMGSAYATALKNENINHFKDMSEKAAKEVNLENFAEKMNEEANVIKEALHTMSDEELDKPLMLFGGTAQTKASRWMFLFKNLIAYRMQLFLYIKATGNDKIGTHDNRMGEDPKQH